MRLYSCKVRLSGSVMNEVPKVMPTPEILVMLYLHGNDSVIDIALHSETSKTQAELREYLKMEYDQYLGREKGGRNPTSIDQMFGAYNKLPDKLPDEIYIEAEDAEEALASIRELADKETTPAERKANARKREPAPTPNPVDIVDA